MAHSNYNNSGNNSGMKKGKKYNGGMDNQKSSGFQGSEGTTTQGGYYRPMDSYSGPHKDEY